MSNSITVRASWAQPEPNVVLGLVGEAAELGQWGANSSCLLFRPDSGAEETPASTLDWIAEHTFPVSYFIGALQFRLVLFNKATNQIVAVDRKRSSPNALPKGTTSIRIDTKTECRFEGPGCGFEGLPFVLEQGSGKLQLNIFPFPCDGPSLDQGSSTPIQLVAVELSRLKKQGSGAVGTWFSATPGSAEEDLSAASPEQPSSITIPFQSTKKIPDFGPRCKGRSTGSEVYWTASVDLSSLTRNTVLSLKMKDSTESGGPTALAYLSSRNFRPGVLQGRFSLNAISPTDGFLVGVLDVIFNVVTPTRFQERSRLGGGSFEPKPLKYMVSPEELSRLKLPASFVGHRGSGVSLHNRRLKGKLTENTIPSFLAAGNRSCSFVEFDVVLSKDGVPMVYHDLLTGLLATSPIDQADNDALLVPSRPKLPNVEVVPIGVHQLTRRQLQTLNLVPIHTMHPIPKLKALILKHWTTIISVRSPVSGPKTPSRSSVNLGGDFAVLNPMLFSPVQVPVIHPTMPLLSDLFTALPTKLGLMIEVKFPNQPKYDAMLHQQAYHYEVNRIVDEILKIVFRFAGDRQNINFCSFEPNVAQALVLKQCRFPVFFLADSTDDDLRDHRCFSMESAVQFAAHQGMAGVSINSAALFDDPTVPAAKLADPELPAAAYGRNLVGVAHELGLGVWTWSGYNDSREWTSFQIDSLGVDAIITDRVS
jgi:glycerophosphoryl diester phosphodiesterase